MANTNFESFTWKVEPDIKSRKSSGNVFDNEYFQNYLTKSVCASMGVPSSMFDRKPRLINVIFRNPTTITEWSDGDKIICNATNEEFSEEKGLAMCVVKKFMGNYTDFDNALKNAKHDNSFSRKDKKIIKSMLENQQEINEK